MCKGNALCMRIQVVGFGNVGKSLIGLIDEKKEILKSLGVSLKVVSISDSTGTAREKRGLVLGDVLRRKEDGWKGFKPYYEGYSALSAIRDLAADVVVELTPSTSSGEPGLSHIKAALGRRKSVVTANKGPLVVAYEDLMNLAKRKRVRLLYEATVAAHLPVFCMIESCFRADQLVRVEGILNGTTNFIIGQMEKGRDFQACLDHATKEGWAETNYLDDVDGIDAARKTVILANSYFKRGAKLEDVKIDGIRNIGKMIEKARSQNKRVKLICNILRKEASVQMSVSPRLVALDDPFAAVNGGDMALKLFFKTSQQIFVSAQFTGVKQTAYAVLNDIIKMAFPTQACRMV
jgi:homoserine dehydrogenase